MFWKFCAIILLSLFVKPGLLHDNIISICPSAAIITGVKPVEITGEWILNEAFKFEMSSVTSTDYLTEDIDTCIALNVSLKSENKIKLISHQIQLDATNRIKDRIIYGDHTIANIPEGGFTIDANVNAVLQHNYNENTPDSFSTDTRKIYSYIYSVKPGKHLVLISCTKIPGGNMKIAMLFSTRISTSLPAISNEETEKIMQDFVHKTGTTITSRGKLSNDCFNRNYW